MTETTTTTSEATPGLRYQHVLRFATASPWAIMPEKLDEIAAFLEFKATGGTVPPDVVQAYEAATQESRQLMAGPPPGVAVIRIGGVISQRMSLLSAFSGGTSTEQIGQYLRMALNDPNVEAILLDVDSPGGSVFGVEELAAEIRAARSRKPIVAIANSMMASAAYWIASAADQIVASPGAIVGSVGVLAMHTDYSQRNEQDGVKITLIRAGKYKAEGNPDFPLDTEAAAHMQSEVDRYYGMFTKAVAAGRGVLVATVRDDFGQGRAIGAPAALAAGMIDRIETFEQLMARLSTPQGRSALKQRQRATNEDGDATPTARDEEQSLRDAGLSRREAKVIIALRRGDGALRDAADDEPSAEGDMPLVAVEGSADDAASGTLVDGADTLDPALRVSARKRELELFELMTV